MWNNFCISLHVTFSQHSPYLRGGSSFWCQQFLLLIIVWSLQFLLCISEASNPVKKFVLIQMNTIKPFSICLWPKLSLQNQICTAYSGSAVQPQRRNRTRIIIKFLFCFSAILWTPQLFQYILLYYTPQPSKSAKKKAAGITKARQSCHTSQASNPALWVPDFETNSITPEDSVPASYLVVTRWTAP